MSALKPLSPAEVSRRLAKGRVTLVDVREPHEYAREHIAGYKVPRSVDFRSELPRLPTGKLYKRVLRDEYWAGDSESIGSVSPIEQITDS